MKMRNLFIIFILSITFIVLGIFIVPKNNSILERKNTDLKEFVLTATPDYTNHAHPSVILDWSDYGDDTTDTIFKGYQSKDGGETWENISLMNFSSVEEVKVLNVYPGVGDGLKSWMETSTDSSSGEVIGKGIIKVDKVTISDFNRNPSNYLTKTDSTWNYDVVVFGFWDRNNYYDISSEAKNLVVDFIEDGKGVILGHDTAVNNSLNLTDTKIFDTDTQYRNGQLNFSEIATSYLPIHWHNDLYLGSTIVEVTKKGLLSQYPWDLGPVGTTYTIPTTHTWGQVLDDTSNVYMKFKSVTEEVEGSNFYIVSSNNVSMIMTGHSNGSSTEAERKILANLIFYGYQVSSDTNVVDYSGMDLDAPKVPTAIIEDKSWEIDVTFQSTDIGTEYQYYVEGYDKSDMSEATSRSNTATTTVTSGLAGYYFVIDNNPENDFNVADANFLYDHIAMSSDMYGMYIHLKAVDRCGNISEVADIHIVFEKHNIIFRLDGGTLDGFDNDLMAEFNVYTMYDIPVPVKNKYVFKEWAKLNSCESPIDGNQITVLDDCEIKAIWSEDVNDNAIADENDTRVTVTYTDGCNHTSFQDYVVDNILVNTTTPPFEGNPTRKNYLFVGWNPNVSEVITEDTTYVAVWEEDKNNNGVADKEDTYYKITFKDGLNNQVFTEFSIDVLTGLKIPEFDSKLLKNEFYEFRGWDSPIDIVPTEDKVFTAQWNLILHDIPDTKINQNSAIYIVSFIIFVSGIICVGFALKALK